VVAHEVGHIVHRHMNWYVLFMAVLVLLNAAIEQWIDRKMGGYAKQARDVALSAFALAKFLILFGFLSRRFERQADVFAARTIESIKPVAAAAGATFLSPEDSWGDAPVDGT